MTQADTLRNLCIVRTFPSVAPNVAHFEVSAFIKVLISTMSAQHLRQTREMCCIDREYLKTNKNTIKVENINEFVVIAISPRAKHQTQSQSRDLLN